MCLSATVSFTASALLTAGGAAIIVKAARSNWRYLPIGLMPLFAGIQQFSEGFVWVGMNTGDNATMTLGAMGFIFFTWFMWPFWIPFSVWVLEPSDSRRRPWLMAMTLVGIVFGLMLYIPHGFGTDWLVVTVNQNSLAYENSMLLDQFLPRWLTYTIYVLLITVPPLLSRYRHMRHFAVTVMVVVVLDVTFLRYAYISFFCLLAGLATLHLAWIILTNKCAEECPELFGHEASRPVASR
ncbi:DUF6629 family protein [Tabrizicola sp.]|jgi:hypothetical protein|uniref:DUF6629 family protein n=1 Tax=Tabrizicola sp. TaxID=2005166 RepID=UPI0025F7BF77|nr:DUF6629 family protein [Tabrizicola sp.]MBY0349545.1 hypothetical protein [Tabrizicola sp.]